MPATFSPSLPDFDEVLRHVATGRAAEFIEWCGAAGRTVATAESLTGGAIASALSVLPGAGEVFKGSVVTYRPETKHEVLGVRQGPVVAADAAVEMARAAVTMFGSDLAVAVTGVAGPDTQEGVPVGTVFLAVADGDYRTLSSERHFPGSPSEVRVATVRAAIELLDWFAHCRNNGRPGSYQAISSQP
jgi:nicotinamide-nucleotide amidase